MSISKIAPCGLICDICLGFQEVCRRQIRDCKNNRSPLPQNFQLITEN